MMGDHVVKLIWIVWPYVAWAVFATSLLALLLERKAVDNMTGLEEKKSRRRIKWLCVFAVWFLVIGIVQLDPLQRYPDTVRANILRSTPIGMSYNDVTSIINSASGRRLASRWRVRNIAVYTNDLYCENGSSNVREGRSHASQHLGLISYFFIFRADVYAGWQFDENGLLIDVRVSRFLRI